MRYWLQATKRTCVALAGLMIVSTGAQAVPAKGSVDSKADQILRRMSDYLARTKAMSFTAASSTEIVTKEGEKIDFEAESKVSVQRPNKLRSDRIGEIANLSFYYDGKSIAMFGKETRFYATEPAPPKLDDAIEFSRKTLGIEAPGADLLFSKPYEVLTEDLTSGRYVGVTEIEGRPAHHLAFRGSEVDWQIWIADGDKPLPLKYQIVSKNVPQAPEFEVRIENWNTSPTFAQDHFSFQPPSDAKRILFAKNNNQKNEMRTR